MSDNQGGADDFKARLEAARARHGLDAARERAAPDQPKAPSALGVGFRVGVELVSALIVAVAIGWALDRWLGTTPVLLALFVLLGGAAGVANVWRLMGPGRGRAGPGNENSGRPGPRR